MHITIVNKEDREVSEGDIINPARVIFEKITRFSFIFSKMNEAGFIRLNHLLTLAALFVKIPGE